jgi:hypothetical protein
MPYNYNAPEMLLDNSSQTICPLGWIHPRIIRPRGQFRDELSMGTNSPWGRIVLGDELSSTVNREILASILFSRMHCQNMQKFQL